MVSRHETHHTITNKTFQLKMSKKFYSAGGFELTLEDGSFMVFPPDIVLESILTITKKLITNK